MSQSFEKKIKIRDGKKRHINFSYFLARPKRLNELFVKASSYEPTPRKKDEIPQSNEILCVYFPIFLPELNG